MQGAVGVRKLHRSGMFIVLGLLELNGHLEPVKAVGLSCLASAVPDRHRPGRPGDLHPAPAARAEVMAERPDAAAAGTGKRLGSYADLFGGGWVTRHAVLAMLLAFVGGSGCGGSASSR